MLGVALTSGDGLGNGLETAGAEDAGETDPDGDGNGASVAAADAKVEPPTDPAATKDVSRQAAAMPAALLND
jgi:hypothetical protein